MHSLFQEVLDLTILPVPFIPSPPDQDRTGSGWGSNVKPNQVMCDLKSSPTNSGDTRQQTLAKHLLPLSIQRTLTAHVNCSEVLHGKASAIPEPVARFSQFLESALVVGQHLGQQLTRNTFSFQVLSI